MPKTVSAYLVVAWLLLGLLAAMHIGAHADDGHHGRHHAGLHSWYNLLFNKKGESCCNNTDCRPSAFRSGNGKAEIMLDGEWVPLPEDAVIPEVAPDKGTHVCAPKQPSTFWPKGTVFCVVIGTGS